MKRFFLYNFDNLFFKKEKNFHENIHKLDTHSKQLIYWIDSSVHNNNNKKLVFFLIQYLINFAEICLSILIYFRHFNYVITFEKQLLSGKRRARLAQPRPSEITALSLKALK